MQSTLSYPTQDPVSSIERRRVLRLAGAPLLAGLIPAVSRAQSWQEIEEIRKSVEGASISNEGLQLTLPLVAEDGSSVPLGVSAAGMGSVRFERLELFAPRNPTPRIAVFELAPEVGQLNLTTRIRLSESQTVVAVAHADDGRAYVAERAVRVTTSGCIAPARSDPAAEMKARVRMPKLLKSGEPGEVLTMISHPMITGLNADASGQTPAMRIIERFEATLDGRPVITADFFRSLAANPYLKFDFFPSRAGEMRFRWKEDTGREAVLVESVRLA